MMDVTEKLHRDHEKVEGLFAKLEQSGDGAEKTRKELFRQLEQELKAHTEFENQVFYPAVRDAAGGGGVIAEALEEHEAVEKMLLDLGAMEPTSAEFMDTLRELERNVKEHVAMEEEKIFQLAGKGLDRETGEQMARRHDEMAQQSAASGD